MTAPVKPKRRRRRGARALLEDKPCTRQPRGFRSPEGDECRLLSPEEALASSVLRVAYLDLRAGRLGMVEWWQSDHIEILVRGDRCGDPTGAQTCPTGGAGMKSVDALIKRLDRMMAEDRAAAQAPDWPAARARMAIWRNQVQSLLRGDLSLEEFEAWQDADHEQQPAQSKQQRHEAGRVRAELLARL